MDSKEEFFLNVVVNEEETVDINQDNLEECGNPVLVPFNMINISHIMMNAKFDVKSQIELLKGNLLSEKLRN